MGGSWQFSVIFGLHWGLVPIMLSRIGSGGFTVLAGPVLGAVMAQAAAGPAAFSGFLAGITDPAESGADPADSSRPSAGSDSASSAAAQPAGDVLVAAPLAGRTSPGPGPGSGVLLRDDGDGARKRTRRVHRPLPRER